MAGEWWLNVHGPTRGNFSRSRAHAPSLKPFIFNAEPFARVDHLAAELLRSRDKHLTRFGILSRYDDGHAFLDDAGFFAGNFAQRMAQKILVVEDDKGDHRDYGREDVCRIQAAPQSHLEYAEINALPGEILK